MIFSSVIDLKNYIHSKISDYIQHNCVLLNAPDHVNVGDQLIFQGEIDFLSQRDIIPNYISSLFTLDWRDFSPDTLILLHGGGNFGDVWDEHQDFRLKVIKKYIKNRIFIFPQSVQYNNHNSLLNDAKSFSEHPNLTICARDNYSYELLKQHFNNEILLVPDMAFCSSYMNQRTTGKGGMLLLKRRDREIPTTIPFRDYSNFEISDWPTFNFSFKNLAFKSIEKANRLFSKNIYYKINKGLSGDTTFGTVTYRDREYLISQGVEFISNFDLVVSTRLHGHILSLLMGIPTIMIDNNYGKNSRFYNTWLQNIPNNSLVSSKEELDNVLKRYVN
jgi:pyruvyl transferase EpsO